MKIEKLTENKIRITLNVDDLREKNIDLHTFMSNSIETQDIFIDMLKEADKKVGFKTEDYKILLEAIATSDGMFVLTVTRISPEVNTFKKKQVHIKRKSVKLDKELAIYKFSTFDDFCDFCIYLNNSSIKQISKHIKKITLYSYQDCFYLALNKILADVNELKTFCSIITEFSSYINHPDLFQCKLQEYGKVIIKANAINACSKYFVK